MYHSNTESNQMITENYKQHPNEYLIALCTNDIRNFWTMLWLRHWTWPAQEFCIGKSHLWRFLLSKETKSSLVSIPYIPKIIKACQDNVKDGKNCTDKWFYFLCKLEQCHWVMLWHFTKKCVESRASKLFIKRCIVLNL